ncbi:MAG: orotidine 5'-phosphate decarboxylase [Candidatus Syntrophoarchaeum sp.]|nr:orotidine 5'-phosphate decarboxylase [Candidatus Syntrophoarchaeum sp.]
MARKKLQLALDLLETDRAIRIAREASECIDLIEVGTPLIKSEGMAAIRAIRESFPDRIIVADMKTMDTGAIEVEMAAKSGADIIAILGGADDSTIEDAVRSARKYGVKLMADLLSVGDPVNRAKKLEELGIDYICVHVGIDQQMKGMNALDILKKVVDAVNIDVAVAGGLDPGTAAQAASLGACIIIAGGAITRSGDASAAAAAIRDAIDRGSVPEMVKKRPVDEMTIELLRQVSTPNISDAMHRKGAMSGIISICPGLKIAGRAITVQTLPGDWAKPVEAIDCAGKDDVIVIENGRADIAPWGELATLSCMNRKIAGVVIDGAVRDVDEIRAFNYPIFARAIVPNAGEPKGYGEIGAEIVCGGQIVRNGDYIVGDDSGVVVIPKERAYEIARRAKEVYKTELRIREEIKRGKSLSEVLELAEWEKRSV